MTSLIWWSPHVVEWVETPNKRMLRGLKFYKGRGLENTKTPNITRGEWLMVKQSHWKDEGSSIGICLQPKLYSRLCTLKHSKELYGYKYPLVSKYWVIKMLESLLYLKLYMKGRNIFSILKDNLSMWTNCMKIQTYQRYFER